ncbi:MAG: hypothetical protein ACE37F_22210 [Nannocystaceae bacterium]|nr:hypothetical protein [bacterium]
MPAVGEIFPLVVALLLLGILAGVRLARWSRQRRGRAVARRGARGEADGVRLLEEAGFAVLETQVRAKALVDVDGEPQAYDLWLDAVAARGGQRYVAEFKTGAAASIGHAATRRQMLEYSLSLPDHRLVLVDASSGTVQEVDFPKLRALTE